jgi:hypothetical protein
VQPSAPSGVQPSAPSGSSQVRLLPALLQHPHLVGKVREITVGKVDQLSKTLESTCLVNLIGVCLYHMRTIFVAVERFSSSRPSPVDGTLHVCWRLRVWFLFNAHNKVSLQSAHSEEGLDLELLESLL